MTSAAAPPPAMRNQRFGTPATQKAPAARMPTIIIVPRSRPRIMSPSAAPVPAIAVASTGSSRSRSRFFDKNAPSHTASASLRNSDGWPRIGPMWIQFLLPPLPSPRGVNTSAWRNRPRASSSVATPMFLYHLTGVSVAAISNTRPMTAKAPWVMNDAYGECPFAMLVTEELESTITRPAVMRMPPITAIA